MCTEFRLFVVLWGGHPRRQLTRLGVRTSQNALELSRAGERLCRHLQGHLVGAGFGHQVRGSPQRLQRPASVRQPSSTLQVSVPSSKYMS